MIISELEAKLKEIREQHGDFPVMATIRSNDRPSELNSLDISVRTCNLLLSRDQYVEICGWID